MNQSVEHWRVGKRSVISAKGVVAAQHWLAARAGADMLHRGGNAVDAAIAAAFALAAVEPWMCGLGGSGYMVIWQAAAKTATVIDFQGMLPAAIDPDDYPIDPGVAPSIMGFSGVAGRLNSVGARAITVPGAVKGLSFGLEKFGSFGLDTVLNPAIKLVERGLPCDWFATLQIALAASDLALDPAAARTYLPNGAPPVPGQYLKLGRLAETLKTLADHGPCSVYGGAIGQSMVADLHAGGSRITLDDFAAYEVLEQPSLAGMHRGVALHTAGPTSGGPRLIETLNYIEQHFKPSAAPCAASWKIYADGLNKAWRHHMQQVGRITERGGCTSHLSTVDKDGNMVALTYTLLSRFGACVMLPGSGILMNNAVSYFDMRPGYPTSMRPHLRINASNMCPTIAVRGDDAVFAIGASGANFIQPCTTQIAALMLDFGLSLEAAINHPRIDASGGASIRVDPRLGEDILATLAESFELEIAQRLVFPKLYACPSGVCRDPLSGLCGGINDPSQPVGGAAASGPFSLDELTDSVDVIWP